MQLLCLAGVGDIELKVLQGAANSIWRVGVAAADQVVCQQDLFGVTPARPHAAPGRGGNGDAALLADGERLFLLRVVAVAVAIVEGAGEDEVNTDGGSFPGVKAGGGR